MSKKAFTHIIVGGGTAGCLLANRLSSDASRSVLLIEAGMNDRYQIWMNIPVGYLFCIGNPKTDWMLRMDPCKGLNGRSLMLPRGKALGGCSSINGMIYMRGQSRDYEHWANVTGDASWNWENVLRRFKKHENYWGGAGKYHGADGEWIVSKQRLRWDILEAYSDAAVSYGIPRVKDFNTGDNFGTGLYDVNQRNGWRWSANSAFIQSVNNRPNLVIMTKTNVAKIRINPQTKTVEGVDVRAPNKSEVEKYLLDPSDKRAEVILCAGAIHSPQLLQVSGVGPAELLKTVGIDVIQDLPGVGENLQDHLQVRTEFMVKGCETLNRMTRDPIALAKVGLEYMLYRTGPLSMAPSQMGVITRSDPGRKYPNVQFHVQPLSLDAFGQPLHKFPAVTASVTNMNPTSRGYVRVRSPDLRVAPSLQLNYLDTEDDKDVAVKSIQLAREIAKQSSFAKYLVGERKPGKDVVSAEALVKAAGDISSTIFHPVGTCKMGRADDPLAVVTPDMHVRGLQKIRVVDASIMPDITSGNTNSPTLMIAETAAEKILA